MRKIIAVPALALALAFPAAAGAQTADEGYGQAPGTRSTGSADGSGSLPFTGLEVGALAALGTGLVGVGAALHASRRRSST